jgi:hypothetical protein
MPTFRVIVVEHAQDRTTTMVVPLERVRWQARLNYPTVSRSSFEMFSVLAAMGLLEH